MQRRPANLVENSIRNFTRERSYGEELQVNRAAVPVTVPQLRNPRPDLGRNPKLLVQLAGESLLGGFARLNLAAGELPFQSHRLVCTALAHQNFHLAASVGGWSAENQRRYNEPKRLAVLVSVQFSDALFHSGRLLRFRY